MLLAIRRTRAAILKWLATHTDPPASVVDWAAYFRDVGLARTAAEVGGDATAPAGCSQRMTAWIHRRTEPPAHSTNIEMDSHVGGVIETITPGSAVLAPPNSDGSTELAVSVEGVDEPDGVSDVVVHRSDSVDDEIQPLASIHTSTRSTTKHH